ncbi:MAG: phage minor head protein [Thermodesulfobacteriota bacterium]
MPELELRPLPMAEAQEFWRDKVMLSPSQFRRLSAEARLRAFAIGGIAKGDELATVFTALQRAIDQGISFEQFKEECGDIFTRRGWTGLRAWRVDNVFRTNIQTAYNVGRYRQLKGMADAFPYWRYSAVNDSRTRPTHLAMNGLVYPAGHPFWNTWYPPNGFRCRCSVVPLTAGQVKSRGLTVRTEIPQMIEPIDPTTGNRMPAMQLLPDPGFAYNPGQVAWGGIVEQAGRGRFEDLPGLLGPADYRRRALDNVRPAVLADLTEDMLLPAGQADDFYRAEFIRRYGEEQVLTDAAGEPVILSLRSFMVDKTPGAPERWKFGKSGHGESIPWMAEAVTNPYEVWLVPQRGEDGTVRLTRRYICLWKTEDKTRVGGVAIYEVVGGVLQGVTNFVSWKKGQPDLGYLERLRHGVLLFGR